MKNQIDPSSIPQKIQKKEPEYLTHKEMLKFISGDSALFDYAADLMLAVEKMKSRHIHGKDVLSSWHCWTLYPRADVERLVRNRFMQCSMQFLIEHPTQPETGKGD